MDFSEINNKTIRRHGGFDFIETQNCPRILAGNLGGMTLPDL